MPARGWTTAAGAPRSPELHRIERPSGGPVSVQTSQKLDIGSKRANSIYWNVCFGRRSRCKIAKLPGARDPVQVQGSEGKGRNLSYALRAASAIMSSPATKLRATFAQRFIPEARSGFSR